MKLNLSREQKTSRAMARCILTGVSALVLSFLIWKTVAVFGLDVPFTFHLTCALVGVTSVVATGGAVYRLSRPLPKIQKKPSVSNHSRVKSRQSTTLIPIVLGKNEMIWYQRN